MAKKRKIKNLLLFVQKITYQFIKLFKNQKPQENLGLQWGERSGSNRRQPVPQTGALPTELRSPSNKATFTYKHN